MEFNGFMISLILCLLPSSISAVPARGVTHEDIRDAIISVVHMFRDLTEKLERHELRERTLGEQLKRALSGLDKRERAQDDRLNEILTTVKTIDNRLVKIEQQAAGVEIREKDIYTVDNQHLQTWMADLEGKLIGQGQNKDLGKVVGSLEGSLASRYESFEKELRRIEQAIKNLQTSTDGKMEKMIDSVLTNTDRAKQEIIDNQAVQSASNMREIEKHSGELSVGQRAITATLAEATRMSDNFFKAVTGSYTQLSHEIKSLPKVEQILLQTADNVMDTKRRVEYGVHQILMEVGELIRTLGKDLNSTVNTRFNDISTDILDNQNEGLNNLTTKVETEISQVWRQIGVMYKQLSASAGTLDSLQKQTETYVNGSLSTMDGMENKVTLITGRMNEVDENLNYLLGRLSLVTQEFNLTKSALALALDNIRSSFRDVQDKVKSNPGPGPNMITSDESVDNLNNNV